MRNFDRVPAIDWSVVVVHSACSAAAAEVRVAVVVVDSDVVSDDPAEGRSLGLVVFAS